MKITKGRLAQIIKEEVDKFYLKEDEFDDVLRSYYEKEDEYTRPSSKPKIKKQGPEVDTSLSQLRKPSEMEPVDIMEPSLEPEKKEQEKVKKKTKGSSKQDKEQPSIEKAPSGDVEKQFEEWAELEKERVRYKKIMEGFNKRSEELSKVLIPIVKAMDTQALKVKDVLVSYKTKQQRGTPQYEKLWKDLLKKVTEKERLASEAAKESMKNAVKPLQEFLELKDLKENEVVLENEESPIQDLKDSFVEYMKAVDEFLKVSQKIQGESL